MKINTSQLKWIALVLMTIDHVASLLIPNNTFLYIVFRGIGRLAAPLFWFGFIEGYKYTRNKDRYKLRLCIAAIVMFITNGIVGYIYPSVPMSIKPLSPNMFLSFLILSFVVDFLNLQKDTSVFWKKILFIIPILLLLCFVAPIIDYGFHMIIFGIVFTIIKNSNLRLSIFAVMSCLICLLTNNVLQIFMIFSIFIIRCYNNRKPKRNYKWFFYLYYPTHIYGLVVISSLLA